MFRGLSSWLGLQQPEADGRRSEEAGQPEGNAPPEPPAEAEAAAESAERELLHQAKDLGGESPPGPERVRSAPALLFTGRGAGGRKVCLSVCALRTGEVGEELGKAEAASSGQILCLKFLVTCHSLQSVNIGSRAAVRWPLGLTRSLFCSTRQLSPQSPTPRAGPLGSLSRLKNGTFCP